MNDSDLFSLGENSQINDLLIAAADPSRSPGAIAVSALIASLAASIGRSALQGESLSIDAELSKFAAKALDCGDADTIAYWSSSGKRKADWVRNTPSALMEASQSIFEIAAAIEGGNRIDARVGKLFALSAFIAGSIVKDGNVENLSSESRRDNVLVAGGEMRTLPSFRAIEADHCWIIDEEGNRWLDATSGLWNVPLGHGHIAPLAGFMEQALQVAALNSFSYSSPTANDTATLLLDLTGLGDGVVFFCSSGSEAVETALRFAIASTPPTSPIWSLPFAFHGSTAGAAGLSGFDSVFTPLPPRLKLAKACEPQNWTAPGIAFIEPASMAAAAYVPANWLDDIRRFQMGGGILVADEVASGLGRTFWPLACHRLSINPDILVLGKGLSNGVSPLSCVIATNLIREKVSHFGYVDFGHTHSNHPASLGAAKNTISELAVIDHEAAAEKLNAALTKGRFRFNQIGMAAAVKGAHSVSRNKIKKALNKVRLLCHIPTVQQEVESLIIAPPLIICDRECEELTARIECVTSEVGW